MNNPARETLQTFNQRMNCFKTCIDSVCVCVRVCADVHVRTCVCVLLVCVRACVRACVCVLRACLRALMSARGGTYVRCLYACDIA